MFRYKHRHQTGGPGEYAVIEFDIQPTSWGTVLEFENRVTGGAIAKSFAESVRDGVLCAMRRGVLGEGPLVGIRFVLLGGETHSRDSSEKAFFAAGRDGFREAIRSFAIGVLEPIVALEISVASECVGAVLADLASRNADVTELAGAARPVIRALAPQASVQEYADALASLTGGDAEWSWRISHYDLRR